MAQELGWYLQDSSSLLRDQNNLFTSVKQLTRWINQARREAAKITGCIRVLVSGTAPAGAAATPGAWIPGGGVPGQATQSSFQTIPSVEMYSYEYGNRFVRAQNTGVKAIIDVLDVSVSWGATRPTLNWMPWGDLQALARSYNVGVTSFPFAWACQGDGTRGKVFLFPIPSQGGVNGEMEWDVICIPTDLVDNDSYDAIPESFQDAIKFRAVALAMLASQRYLDAQIHTQMFLSELGVDRASAKLGAVADYYWGVDLP